MLFLYLFTLGMFGLGSLILSGYDHPVSNTLSIVFGVVAMLLTVVFIIIIIRYNPEEDKKELK